MATPETVKIAVVNTPQIKTVFDFMREKKDLISKALPKTITPDRLIGVFTMLFNSSPKLMECTQVSLVAAVIQTVQLGLTPGPVGHAYYVPFNNKQPNGSYAMEVQFIIGYRGICELVNRSRNASILNAECVYMNDQFEYEKGLKPILRHIPADGDRGAFRGVYCIAKNMLANEKVFIYLSAEEIDKIKRASKAATSAYSPWVTWFELMAMKSAVKRIAKLLPLSLEVQREISADETIKTKIEKDIIDVPDSTNWSEQKPEEPAGLTAADKSFITEEQRKQLLGIAGGKGKPKEDVNAFILKQYTIDSTTKIPVFLYDEICAYYKKMPDAPANY